MVAGSPYDTRWYTSGFYRGANPNATPEFMWNYGFEAWCNLEGRYVTIVADISNLSGAAYE